MMTEFTGRFPILVYQSPGDLCHPRGFTYRFIQVNDDLELQSRLESGWVQSSELAIRDAIDRENVDYSTPPTRAELLGYASDLGLKVPKNITTAKLLSLIEQTGQ